MLRYYEREVTVVLVDLMIGEEGAWLVHILDKLDFLEFLELWGDCSPALRRLGRRLARSTMQMIDVKTLIVRGKPSVQRSSLNASRVI